MTINAVILAGRRPERDPLIAERGVSTKALLPVAGEAMLIHVVRALRAAPSVGRITILAQDSAALSSEPALAGLSSCADLSFADSGPRISASLAAFIAETDAPLLVTTADHVLLTRDMVSDFLAIAGENDIAIAMVERAVLQARFPHSQRTWITLRGGAWSGANLFRFSGRKTLPLLRFWSAVEQERKKGLRIIAAFGPLLFLAALFRLITLQQGVQQAGKRFGLKATAVPMTQSEACIDIDKVADIDLAESILAERRQTHQE